MNDIDKHTAFISAEPYRPLQIEFRENYSYNVRIDKNGHKKTNEPIAVIYVPSSPRYDELYILSMTPGTALNLLKWLQEHEELLQKLVEER